MIKYSNQIFSACNFCYTNRSNIIAHVILFLNFINHYQIYICLNDIQIFFSLQSLIFDLEI